MITTALEQLIKNKPEANSLILLRENWRRELRDIESGIYLVEHMPAHHPLCARILSRRHELQLLVGLTDLWNEVP